MKVLKSFDLWKGKGFESCKGLKEYDLEDPTDACQRRLQPADVYLTFSFSFSLLFSFLCEFPLGEFTFGRMITCDLPFPPSGWSLVIYPFASGHLRFTRGLATRGRTIHSVSLHSYIMHHLEAGSSPAMLPRGIITRDATIRTRLFYASSVCLTNKLPSSVCLPNKLPPCMFEFPNYHYYGLPSCCLMR